jgi:hypothetical protein
MTPERAGTAATARCENTVSEANLAPTWKAYRCPLSSPVTALREPVTVTGLRAVPVVTSRTSTTYDVAPSAPDQVSRAVP